MYAKILYECYREQFPEYYSQQFCCLKPRSPWSGLGEYEVAGWEEIATEYNRITTK